MDCDFFENSYFYPQLRPQGEIICDDLIWLIHPITIDLDPKEQVGYPTDIATEDIVLPSPQASPTLSDASSEQEVISDPQEVLTEPESLNNACTNVSSVVELPCRYELPLKSTRGIPPRRYDPDFEEQRS